MGAGVVVGALEAGGLSDDVELVGLVVGHGLATDVVMVTIVGLGLGEAVTLGWPAQALPLRDRGHSLQGRRAADIRRCHGRACGW